MVEYEELKKIKKMYGERFMYLCRELFPTILEQEGMLYEILSSTFSGNSKTLYNDIVDAGLEEEFKNYIYSKIDVEKETMDIIEERTPYELLEEVGYELTECETEEQIQWFKKYYAEGEELCTFNGGRLNRCVVFWAVKKDVGDIKRENFKKPSREDEYGTSVMGIQFSKSGRCTVSIKNRYNHKVNNPDATYGNDLDRITPGLTQSFARLLQERGLELDSGNIEQLNIPNYVVASDGKYYKYNMEVNGTYYCPGNIVVRQGTVERLENSQMLIDYFVLDIKNKRLYPYDDRVEDSFTSALQDIEKIEVRKKTGEERTRVITISIKGKSEPIIIEIDENNQIIGYKNNDLRQVGDYFLHSNKGLTQLKLPNLERTGNNFLYHSEELNQLETPNLRQVGNNFLHDNEGLTQLKLPNLEQTGHNFLYYNRKLVQFEAPNLRQTEDDFLYFNKGLTQLKLPSLEQVGNCFLPYNEGVAQFEAPNLRQAGNNFLLDNKRITQFEALNLRQIGNDFLSNNEGIVQFEAPNLRQVGDGFLYHNKALTKLEIPKCPKIKERFSHIIDKNLEEARDTKKVFGAKDIAELDKNQELTTSEISFGRKIINRIVSLFKGRNDEK